LAWSLEAAGIAFSSALAIVLHSATFDAAICERVPQLLSLSQIFPA
jgi:hypothetical protein